MTPEIHHFGMVVPSLERFLAQSIWEVRGEIVSDPVQKARLCLVVPTGGAGTPLVELIEPLQTDSPTWQAARKGPGWHHVCLAVPSRAAADEYIRQKRLLAFVPWQPAVLFGGRAIRFAYSRNREVLEFLTGEIIL